MDDLLPNLLERVMGLPAAAIAAAAGALAVLLLGVVAWRLFRRRRPAAPDIRPDLTIDVASLGQEGPPEGPPLVEFYNLPVRVAAVVLAPVGRTRQLPPAAELPGLLDAIVPGLDRVVARHQPLIRPWPAQLSARGFAHLFFSNVRLPGEGGKGTPWSSAAGAFKLRGLPMMAGLVLCAASPNGFGQMILDSPEKWLGCFRVKLSGS